MDFIGYYISPLGGMTLSSDGEALTGLRFDTVFTEQEKDLPVFDETKRWLDTYFKGIAPDFTPPLKLRGSDFRKAVWKILLEIPFGQTTTYGRIATRFPVRMAARAIGGAVGHNPVVLIVPCHRVIGANGKLIGYAAGTDKKIKLLELEKIRSDNT